MDGNVLLVKLDSRIDTSNAAEVEKQLTELLDKRSPTEVILDAEKLEYISSVGLRVLLKVKRLVGRTRIVNVSREVYDILSMTGFTQMLDVKKALRQISVEGCRELGSGSFGTTYRLDDETIVKVYHEGVSTEDIERERASAKAAELLKTLANARPRPGSFPRYADISLKLLINSVPERDTLVHRDFHTRNIFAQGDELILIDMEDTSNGHPLFELGSMYMSLVLMSRVPAKLFRKLVWLEKKQAAYFFDRVFEQRFSDIPSQEQKLIRQIVKLFSYLRIISMVSASGTLEKLPVFVRKLTLHSMRNSVKRLYFNKSDEVIGILERVTALF